MPAYPARPVARDETAAKELKARTLTNLYNARPHWLAGGHAERDAAVASAYGWDAGISEDDAMYELLAGNRNVRWPDWNCTEMFADLKNIVELIDFCTSRFQMYKSAKKREKLILDLLQTYFLIKDCVDEGKQLLGEAGPDPVRLIESMDDASAASTLERWEVTLFQQIRRLDALQELVMGQNHLAVIDPDTQTKIKEIVGYKLDRTISLHGIGAALFIRFMLPVAESAEDRAGYVSLMFGSQSALLDVQRIEQEIADLHDSLGNFRIVVERLLSDDEIMRFSNEAKKKVSFE